MWYIIILKILLLLLLWWCFISLLWGANEITFVKLLCKGQKLIKMKVLYLAKQPPFHPFLLSDEHFDSFSKPIKLARYTWMPFPIGLLCPSSPPSGFCAALPEAACATSCSYFRWLPLEPGLLRKDIAQSETPDWRGCNFFFLESFQECVTGGGGDGPWNREY